MRKKMYNFLGGILILKRIKKNALGKGRVIDGRIRTLPGVLKKKKL
jgi:hypothetical protein